MLGNAIVGREDCVSNFQEKHYISCEKSWSDNGSTFNDD